MPPPIIGFDPSPAAAAEPPPLPCVFRVGLGFLDVLDRLVARQLSAIDRLGDPLRPLRIRSGVDRGLVHALRVLAAPLGVALGLHLFFGGDVELEEVLGHAVGDHSAQLVEHLEALGLVLILGIHLRIAAEVDPTLERVHCVEVVFPLRSMTLSRRYCSILRMFAGVSLASTSS